MSFMSIAQHEYEEDIVRAVLSSLKGKHLLQFKIDFLISRFGLYEGELRKLTYKLSLVNCHVTLVLI